MILLIFITLTFRSLPLGTEFVEAYLYVFDRVVADIVEHGYQSLTDNAIMQMKGYVELIRTANQIYIQRLKWF